MHNYADCRFKEILNRIMQRILSVTTLVVVHMRLCNIGTSGFV